MQVFIFMFRLNSSLTFYKDDHFPLHQAENNKKQSLAISIILNKATDEMNESTSVSSDIHIKTILIVVPSIV
jgi:DNA-binding MurR/RpiR family transcriptional regulator